MKIILILLLFALLTVLMTYPLVMHATTAIAGPPGDGFIHLYEMFWFKRAIFDLHVWPLFDPETFYPFGYNLALSHITPSNTLVMMPVVLLAGATAGFNGAVLLSFVLSGFGAYLLVHYLTRQRWAGVIAGILFAFSAYRFHNLGAGWLPNLGTQWLPFALLYLDRVLTRRVSPWRGGALAGFFFALVCLSSWYHVYIAGLAVAVYVLARGWPWRQRLLTWRTLSGALAFCVVAAALILPLALPLLQYGATERDIDWPMYSADDASASVDDLLLPSAYHPWWGDAALDRRTQTFAAVVPGLAYLSIPGMLLGLYALRRRVPASRPWLAVGLVGAVMTLGLTLHVNGLRVYLPAPAAVEDTFSRAMLTLAGKMALNQGAYTPFRVDGGIPLPLPGMFWWLFMPFGSTMRVFHRFALDSSLAFAVLAGMGAAALTRRVWSATSPDVASIHTRDVGRRGTPQLVVGLVLAAVVLVDCLAAPLPYGLSSTQGSPVDLWLREQPGDFSVLHLPLIRSLNGPALYRAAIHGKRISYGYGTFFPKAWREAMTPVGNFPDDASIALLRSWGVRYVLLGQGAYEAGMVDAAGDTWQKVQARLQSATGIRYVRTFEETSPVSGDSLSAKLSKPWNVVPVVADRTHVYEILP